LSQTHKPDSTGGTDHFSYVVPVDGTGGDAICGRALVSGPWENAEKSAVLCYTVMGVEAPEVPNTLMLPVGAMLVLGGGSSAVDATNACRFVPDRRGDLANRRINVGDRALFPIEKSAALWLVPAAVLGVSECLGFVCLQPRR